MAKLLRRGRAAVVTDSDVVHEDARLLWTTLDVAIVLMYQVSSQKQPAVKWLSMFVNVALSLCPVALLRHSILLYAQAPCIQHNFFG